MDKFLHIVFGDSAAGTLKYFFTNNQNEFKGEVINFREDLSIGPICEIDTEAGLAKRIEWLKEMLGEVSAHDYFEDIDVAYEKIKNIDMNSKIVIWYGENTADQVGLRYLNALLINSTLYWVNVSESYIRDYSSNRYKPISLAECAPEEIEHIILTMKKLEKEKCNCLMNDWKVLRTSTENLRILKDNKIVGVDESYYDHDILSNCTVNFQKSARVIGKTMGESEQLVGDTYIDYRVRKLIKSGKVEYRGKLETYLDFEIRVLRGF